jgi:flagellar basal-body rod protein FlgF
MENTLYIALSYQTVTQRKLDVIANNIANVSTAGFKGEQMMFVEYLADALAKDSISFVQDIAVVRDFREGAFAQTGNPLDVAISGQGWLQIDTPTGMRYSRNGHMKIDAQNRLTTASGHPVLSEDSRPITLPAGGGHIVIAPDGTISVDEVKVGRLKLVSFDNEQYLRKEADSLYTTDAPILPAPDARVVQGVIEQSNVKAIIEITNMIGALREYQVAQQVIEEEHKRQLAAIDSLTAQQQA